MEIDENSDGRIDKILSPLGADVTPVITYIDLKNTINSSSISRTRKLPLLILVETAERLENKSTKDSRLSVLEALVLKKLEGLLVTYQKKKWVNQVDYNELIFIINKLK